MKSNGTQSSHNFKRAWVALYRRPLTNFKILIFFPFFSESEDILVILTTTVLCVCTGMCTCMYVQLVIFFYLYGKVRPAQQQVFTCSHGFTAIMQKYKWQYITFNDPDKRSSDVPEINRCSSYLVVQRC